MFQKYRNYVPSTLLFCIGKDNLEMKISWNKRQKTKPKEEQWANLHIFTDIRKQQDVDQDLHVSILKLYKNIEKLYKDV